MSKRDTYIKGEWNVICDGCGKKYKKSEVRLSWDNRLLCIHGCWEPQHPQDFKRAKIDRQSIPAKYARPDDLDAFTETTLAAAASKLDKTLQLASVNGLAQYISIGVETDVIVQEASGITGDNVTATAYLVHYTTVYSVSDPNIVINDPMPEPASIGRKVYILHDSRFLGLTEVTPNSY